MNHEVKNVILLTERDMKVLEFIEKFGVCSERHLLHLLNLEDTHKNREIVRAKIVYRLRKGGYLQRLRVWNNQPAFLTIGKVGAELLKTSTTKIILHTLQHDMFVIDLYQWLWNSGVSQIVTERVRKIELGYHKVKKEVKIPDLLVNNSEAYEVEISEKNKQRLRQIVMNYSVDSAISAVNYFVKSAQLGYKIYKLGSDKFKVFLFDGKDIRTAKELSRGGSGVQQQPHHQTLELDLEQYKKKPF